MPDFSSETFFRRDKFPLYVINTVQTDVIKKHSHDFIELVLIESGTITHTVFDAAGRSFSYGVIPGDFFSILPGEVHAYDNGKQARFFNIAFTRELFSHELAKLSSLDGWETIFGEYNGTFRKKLHLNLNERNEAMGHLKRIILELKLRKPGYQIVARSAFLEMLMLPLRKEPVNYFIDPNIVGDNHITRILNMLESSPEKHFTLAALAKEAGMCIAGLTYKFRQITGFSPMNYLLSLRLEKAAQLLQQTNLPLIDIAQESGFYDSSYLINSFRKRYGITPAKFRVKLLQEQQFSFNDFDPFHRTEEETMPKKTSKAPGDKS